MKANTRWRWSSFTKGNEGPLLTVRDDELGEISLANTYGHTKSSSQVRLIAVPEYSVVLFAVYFSQSRMGNTGLMCGTQPHSRSLSASFRSSAFVFQ